MTARTPSSLDAPIVSAKSRLPPALYSDRLKAVAFRLFGSPRINRHIQVPRKPLLVDPGDTAVLVGTPNPERVAQFQRFVGEQGRAIILEPIESNYEAVDSAAADADQVEVVQKAAAAEPRTEVAPTLEHDGSSQLKSTMEGGDGVAEVEFDTLDAILADLGAAPDFVEVMVNGSEADVLAGASWIMEEFSPRFLVKSYRGRREDLPAGDITARLQKSGYNVARSPIRRRVEGPWTADGDVFGWK